MIFADQPAPEHSIDAVQDEIIDDFGFFDDWDDRFAQIIALGRKLPDLPAELKTEATKVQGCQSQVWMIGEWHGERLRLAATSDAFIVSGLIALLLQIYDNRTAAEILSSPPRFIGEIGLDTHLSPTRSNGLASMVKRIRGLAQAGSQGLQAGAA